MPKITSIIKIASVSLALAALSACANSNGDAAPGLDANGKHPANWVQQHWIKYQEANGGSSDFNGSTACSQCHGTDLSGGVAKVSCFQASFNGQSCHPNNDQTFGHPEGWATDPSSPNFHAKASYNGQAVRGGTALASSASCGLCHDTGAGGTALAAPSCTTNDPSFGIACHTGASPAAAGKSSGCVSCHSAPPSGSARPNRGGAHAAHLALTGVNCNTCHFTFGSGTFRHGTAISQAFLNLSGNYKARTGTFSYTGETCVAAACHGGQQTPVWSTGTLTIDGASCTSCHVPGTAAGFPQYNSYFSGDNTLNSGLANEHVAHLTVHGAVCTDCHSLSTLTVNGGANHYSGLATPAFEFQPRLTIGGGDTKVSAYQRDSIDTKGKCSNTCHGSATIHWFQ